MSTAPEVITALAAARRGVQLYPPSHPAYDSMIGALVEAVRDATERGPLVLNWHEGHLYQDSTVIPPDVHGARTIAEAFEDRRIESLSFHPLFSAEDAVGLTEVLSIRPSPEFDIQGQLAQRSVTGVTAASLADERDSEREDRERERRADRALHHRALLTLRRLQERLASDGFEGLGDTGDLVHHVLGRLTADPSAMLALTTIQKAGERDLTHCLNVMIYSLVLGHRLGLPEEGMASLGMSALLHDIGKSAFDADDSAQADPRRMMHPETGAQILQRVALEDPAPMLVAYEHHMGVDGSGWPERPADYVAHPYSRMVAIADRYENLVDRDAPDGSLTPDRAVIQILRESGTSLDPLFARLFVNALGVFPIGCLVRLTDHSVGVVCSTGDDPLTPVVRIAYDERGTELEDPSEVDLADSDVRITEVITPEILEVAVADKL
jgi:HD-GYP domain-containing protein (c-di-GMP phosphodiesterase class II)